MKLTDYILSLSQEGQHYFTLAQVSTKQSPTSLQVNLHRLQEKAQIACPYRGFYLIVPPVYQAHGSLPAEQFIDDLMRYLDLPYHVGLLSAAQYHGAAHQKVQQFQVVTSRYLRPIIVGNIHIVFTANHLIEKTPTHTINTATGYLKLATAEATAIELLQYPKRSGNINNITMVLSELVEAIAIEKLANCISDMSPEIVTLQRLGYLFDFIESHEYADVVMKVLSSHSLRTRPLVSGLSTKGAVRDRKWKLYINHNIEIDI